MSTYLGEITVAISQSPFSKYTRADWAMYFLERYGQIDGDHHKTWTLDQVARALKGCEPVITLASWDNGHSEYRISLGSSEEYEAWVETMLDRDENGDPQYSYDDGCAP